MPATALTLTIAITVVATTTVSTDTLPASVNDEVVETWQFLPIIGDNEPGGPVVLVRPCDSCAWVPFSDVDNTSWDQPTHTLPKAPMGLVASVGDM